MDERAWQYLRTLVFAALLGIPVAFAAVLFQTAVQAVALPNPEDRAEEQLAADPAQGS